MLADKQQTITTSRKPWLAIPLMRKGLTNKAEIKYRKRNSETLDESSIRLAVVADICHIESNYLELLSRGMERWKAP